MGRNFSLTGGQSTAASATETGVVITAPATMIVKIKRVRVTQRTHTTSEQYQLVAQRASAAGSGGGIPTASEKEVNGPTAASTLADNPTTEPTYTASTEVIETDWNSLVGRDIVFPPGDEPIIPPSGIMGFFVAAPAGATTFTPLVTVEFEEIG